MLLLAGSAGAVTTKDTATWGPLTGSGGAYTTTMQLPGLGNPVANVASDSRAPASVPTGATTWWGATTPPGQQFGSSQGKPYLNLRPKADNATSPSRTTYTFESPPPVGWGFVLGDIDSDQVKVTATRADGSDATVAELGFQSAYNICDFTPRPGLCSGPEPQDTPSWNPGTGVLIGNTAAQDTNGAQGWFVPTVPLKTLTFEFTRRSGFPIFQTWFAARAQDLTGTVSVAAGSTCDVTATTVRLLNGAGDPVATQHPDADGSYRFEKVAATDDFRVELTDVPVVCEVVGPATRTVDLRTADGVADFALREEPHATVAGKVSDPDGGVAGATVVITDDGEEVGRDTTAMDGMYAVPDVPLDSVTATVTPPRGYEVVGERSKDLSVDTAGATVPADFTLRRVAVAPAPGSSPSGSTSGTSGTSTGTPVAALPEVGGVPVGLLVLGGGLALAGAACIGAALRPRRRRS